MNNPNRASAPLLGVFAPNHGPGILPYGSILLDSDSEDEFHAFTSTHLGGIRPRPASGTPHQRHPSPAAPLTSGTPHQRHPSPPPRRPTAAPAASGTPLRNYARKTMPASPARGSVVARDDDAAAAPAASGLLPHPRNVPASPAQVTSINISHSSERPLPREQTIVASRKTTHTDTVTDNEQGSDVMTANMSSSWMR
jgi:hypothetical protein